MTIFVTGGAGFIGSQFIRDWVSAHPGDTVINYDKLTYAANLENLAGLADAPGYQLVRGDVCDPEAVHAAMPEGCDVVVHFAAESHVDRSILSATEFVRANVLGTQVMLDVARARKAGRFLHISTDEVGGDIPEPRAFKEGDPLEPSSPYAASKTAAEHLVNAAVRTFGIDAIVTRTSNNYGPYQFPEKLLPLAISNMMADRPVPVYGDGLQVRDWIHVADNCAALRLVIAKGRTGETYHIGGRNPRTNREVLGLLLDILGKPASLLTQVTDRLGHDRRYAVDCTKIENELGWTRTISFEDGLRATVRWYQENTGWVARAKSGEYREYYEKQYGMQHGTMAR
ncbi:MAG: dTDP-glucose 4,6-dehydratase [Bryobacterales bacterium]|nr:dTDP-glucose 4,6-dehydratase [Bryobacterales bacterium]